MTQERHMRWTPAEYTKVAVNALPLIDEKRRSFIDAFFAAQRVLLPERRRPLEDFKRQHWTLEKYLSNARELPTNEREALFVPQVPRKPPAPRKKLDEGRNYAGMVRWTEREKALITRQVLHWQAQGDTRNLGRLIIEAQELVIPPDRRRSVDGIIQGNATVSGANRRLIEDGKSKLWLIENIPLTTQASAPQEDTEPEAMPEDAPGELSDDATQAPDTPAAPTPAPTTSDALAEAAKAFGDTVMAGLQTLLRTHTEIIMSSVLSKMSANSGEVATSIAAMIERGLRDTVHRIVEAELGGPVSIGPVSIPQPAPVTVSEPPKPEPAPERPRVVRVDVVGLVGTNITKVRESFNGSTDIRFIDPDHLNAWAPHKGRHVVCAVKWIPHKAKFKLRTVGVEPINVVGSAGTVIHAIEELHRKEGISL